MNTKYTFIQLSIHHIYGMQDQLFLPMSIALAPAPAQVVSCTDMMANLDFKKMLPIRLTMDALSWATSGNDSKKRIADVRKVFKAHVPAIHIGEFIGSGGFSDVYTATSDYNGDTSFALKILRTDLLRFKSSTPEQKIIDEMRIKDIKKRFTNESYVQWALSQHLSERVSQSVVKVYDHGEFDSQKRYRFILMERIHSTLRSFIDVRMGNPNDYELLRYKAFIMTKIADLIFNVHQEGIIHRDIKPENIFFYKDKTDTDSAIFRRRYDQGVHVKLGDFGTVRWVRTYSDRYDGVIIGSQWYLSPEQILDPEHLDTRTDIYSFGIVCYELLYGCHPKNVNPETRHILEKLAWAKPLKRTPPKGFETLNEIIFNCMQPIDKRYQGMGEVVRDMRTFIKSLK